MKRAYTMVSLVPLVLILVAAAPAQTGPHSDSGHWPGYMKHHWDKTAANIEDLRFLKLMETLELNEEQSETFLPIFYTFRKDMKSLHGERRALVDSLKEMAAGPDDEERIKSGLFRLRENQKQILARQNEFLTTCETILTTRQLARLVVFQERFERDMLESLREFRKRGSGMWKTGKGKI